MAEDVELGSGRTCFIVSPIGNRLEPIGQPGRARYEESIVMWEEVFEPACQQFGLAPVRADRITEPGEIPDQIFTYLRDADVVIADLSHANPNVMYELGLRHSQPGKLTLQVGEYGQLPFDVTTIRTIQFNRTQAGLIGAREALVESLRSALTGGGGELRATRVFAATNGAIANVTADVEKSIAPDADANGPAAPGILDILAEGEEALTHVSTVLGSATGIAGEIGELSGDFAQRISESDAQSKGFAGRLLLTRELAAKLTEPSNQLESLANDFYADISRLDAMVQYIVARYQSGEEILEAGGLTFLQSLVGLIDSAEGGAVGITQFRDGSRTLSQMSRDLDPAAKTMGRANNRLLEGIALISAWRGPAEGLLAAGAHG
jgi:hypothetical protein